MSEPHNTKQMLKDFGVPRRYRETRVNSLIVDEFCGGIAAYCSNEKARRWTSKKWAVASAAPGRGKTSWLTAVFNESIMDRLGKREDAWLMDSDIPKPIWVSELKMFMMMDQLGSSQGGATRGGYLRTLAKAPLLMLDDVGGGASTSFKLSALQYIIDERYNEDRRTLITTTMKPLDFANFIGNAAASRMAEVATTFHLRGPDKRMSGMTW